MPKKREACLGRFDAAREPLAQSDTAYVRGSVQYVGNSRGFLVATDADFLRPAYTTPDASVGADIGQMSVQLFVTNLTDNTKIIQRPNYFIYPQGYRIRPRTAGVNVGLKF